MAGNEVPQVRWSLRHPVVGSVLAALGCVVAGVLGTVAAGAGIAHSAPIIVFFAAGVAMPIFYTSARRQRVRAIPHGG